MKIVVVKKGSDKVELRPDNTLIRDESNYYLPPFVEKVKLSIGYAIKLERVAKMVEERFSSRYFSHYSPALLITPLIERATVEGRGSLKGEVASALDNITRVPPKLFPLEQFNATPLTLFYNEEQLILPTVSLDFPQLVASQIVRLSSFFTLKVGDMVVTELEESVRVGRGEVIFKEGANPLLSLLIK